MSINTYNKLVRDNIPQIIKDNDKQCEVIQIQDHLMVSHLLTKLNEELNELLESINESHSSDSILEEIADMSTVLDSLIPYIGSYSKYEEIKSTKDRVNGQYYKNLFLVSVTE